MKNSLVPYQTKALEWNKRTNGFFSYDDSCEDAFFFCG